MKTFVDGIARPVGAGLETSPDTGPDPTPSPKRGTAYAVLIEAANTFREKNAVYKNNIDKNGAVLSALFPNGVILNTSDDFRAFGLFYQVISKLTRFANSDLKHHDSIRDLIVYAAMVESVVDTHDIKAKGAQENES